jgi:hypothetical protein
LVVVTVDYLVEQLVVMKAVSMAEQKVEKWVGTGQKLVVN